MPTLDDQVRLSVDRYNKRPARYLGSSLTWFKDICQCRRANSHDGTRADGTSSVTCESILEMRVGLTLRLGDIENLSCCTIINAWLDDMRNDQPVGIRAQCYGHR